MNTNDITIYDPAMSCSTGARGSEVDPTLVRFSTDLAWLAEQGVAVHRFNLEKEPSAFTEDAAAKAVLETKGEAALPLIKVGDDVVSSGAYPSREQLATWAGLSSTPSLYTGSVAELVAMGAAIASNCEPCFKFHYDKARKLGVPPEDMQRAVNTAQNVKEAPARAMLDLAQRYLGQGGMGNDFAASEQPTAKEKAGGCCGPSTQTESAAPKKSSCC